MAQRIQVLCDMHLDREEEVDGQPITFGMGQNPNKLTTYEVDLCEVCSKELVDMLTQFAELGRQVTGPKRTAAKAAPAPRQQALMPPLDSATPEAAKEVALMAGACPLCTYVTKAGAGPKSVAGSLRRHLLETHEQSLEAAVGLPTPFVCPECERAFSRAQGLALHQRRTHK